MELTFGPARLAFLVLLTTIALAACGSGNQPSSAEEFYKQGRDYYQQGQYAQRLNELGVTP